MYFLYVQRIVIYEKSIKRVRVMYRVGSDEPPEKKPQKAREASRNTKRNPAKRERDAERAGRER